MNSFYQTEIRGTFAVGNEKNEEMGLMRPMGLMRGNRAKKHGHGGGEAAHKMKRTQRGNRWVRNRPRNRHTMTGQKTKREPC